MGNTSTIILTAFFFCSRASFARRVASRRTTAAARRLVAASCRSLRACMNVLAALAKSKLSVESGQERKQDGPGVLQNGGSGRNLVGWDELRGGEALPSQLDWVADRTSYSSQEKTAWGEEGARTAGSSTLVVILCL